MIYSRRRRDNTDRRCVHLFAVRIESRGHDFFETSFRRTDDLARMIPTRQPRMKSSHRRATLSGEWILQGRDDGIRHVNRVFSPCNLRIESLFYLPLNATVLLICGGGGLNDNRGASGFSWTTLCVSIAIHTRLSSVKHSYALWSTYNLGVALLWTILKAKFENDFQWKIGFIFVLDVMEVAWVMYSLLGDIYCFKIGIIKFYYIH